MAPTNSGVEAVGKFCTTPVCLEIASGIMSSLAPNYTEIDPCTDFDKSMSQINPSPEPCPTRIAYDFVGISMGC